MSDRREKLDLPILYLSYQIHHHHMRTLDVDFVVSKITLQSIYFKVSSFTLVFKNTNFTNYEKSRYFFFPMRSGSLMKQMRYTSLYFVARCHCRELSHCCFQIYRTEQTILACHLTVHRKLWTPFWWIKTRNGFTPFVDMLMNPLQHHMSHLIWKAELQSLWAASGYSPPAERRVQWGAQQGRDMNRACPILKGDWLKPGLAHFNSWYSYLNNCIEFLPYTLKISLIENCEI